MPEGRQRYFDNDGNPAAGCKLYTYAAGTTTPKDAYTNSAGTVAHQNPITLDAKGEAVIYWNGAYKVDLKTDLGVQITGYPVDNVISDPANVWTLEARLLLTTGAGLVGYADAAIYAANTVGKKLQDLVSSIGSSLIGFIQAGVGAVARTMQAKAREQVSAFDFMTTAEITAVQAYTFTTNVDMALQAAMDAAFAAKCDLFVPAGGYLLTGLTLPGTYTAPDTRSWSFRLHGQGCGNPFTTSYSGSTVFKSVTDAPIIKDNPIVSANSNCSITIDNIKFDGTSNTYPVVLMNTMYGVSSFHHNTIYQRGIGDGFELLYGATCHIHDCYSINKDFVTNVLGAARTGAAYRFTCTYSAGLVGFSKCTARGFKDGFIVDGAGGPEDAYSVSIRDFECSTVYNGITIGTNVIGADIDGGYFEGGDQGTAILIQSPYVTVSDNRIYAGFSTGIDATAAGGGVTITENTINLGAVVNAVGINVTSTGNARNQNVTNNTIIYTLGTLGASGIKINGSDPRMNVFGNYFEPGGLWTGAGSYKINDLSTNGVRGLIQKELGTGEILSLSRGEISLQLAPTVLTQADVTANVLALPSAGSSFTVSATGAATVNKFDAGVTSGRLVLIETTTANMTFSDGAYMNLAGAVSFTGPGMLFLLVNRIGANNYAVEITRSVF